MWVLISAPTCFRLSLKHWAPSPSGEAADACPSWVSDMAAYCSGNKSGRERDLHLGKNCEGLIFVSICFLWKYKYDSPSEKKALKTCAPSPRSRLPKSGRESDVSNEDPLCPARVLQLLLAQGREWSCGWPEKHFLIVMHFWLEVSFVWLLFFFLIFFFQIS